jgi:hypothetical protein
MAANQEAQKQEITFERGAAFFWESRPLNISKSQLKGRATMNNMAKYQHLRTLDTTVSGRLLYLILMDITDTNGAVIIPQRRISEAIGLTKGTVSRNLRKLRDSGYIGVIPQYHSDGGRAANKYIIK